eukprot:TRINITY_DN236_c2_g1_i2.p1 TRINITY_DN236_c2_g1~~TRINITY_DN236_c2_g1_i2.p1  ORF type:complete len:142 (+),score=46.91 TRINITY_DN236_c2_g1_i2:51-476(+)
MVLAKKRYFAVKLFINNYKIDNKINNNNNDDSKDPIISIPHIVKVILSTTSKYLGDWTSACLSKTLNVVYFSIRNKCAIIGCDKKYYKCLWATLTLIKELKSFKLSFNVINVAGTIRACRKSLLLNDKLFLANLQSSLIDN